LLKLETHVKLAVVSWLSIEWAGLLDSFLSPVLFTSPGAFSLGGTRMERFGWVGFSSFSTC